MIDAKILLFKAEQLKNELVKEYELSRDYIFTLKVNPEQDLRSLGGSEINVIELLYLIKWELIRSISIPLNECLVQYTPPSISYKYFDFNDEK